jgi:hypothetical protein
MAITPRLKQRIRGDFGPGAEAVISLLTRLPGKLGVDDPTLSERIQAAAVVVADGDVGRLHDALTLGLDDWRNLLVAAGLADDSWREVLDDRLS